MSDFDHEPHEDFIFDPDLRHSSGKEFNRITTVPQTKATALPATMTFGHIEVGKTSAPQTAVITNTGDRPIEIKEITHSGDFSTSYTNPGTLAPGEQLLVSVIFNPYRSGTITGGIYVDTGDAAGQEYIRLVGGGRASTGGEPEPGGPGIEEAPMDGKLYGRQNANWIAIDPNSVGGGGTPSETQKANASAVGILPTATHMGEFTGTIIPNNVSTKTALQTLSVAIQNLRDSIGGLPTEPGQPGAPGVDAIVAFLTNENHTVTTEANGEVSSYTGASGRFYVFWGKADVSSLFTLVSLTNPQNLNVVYSAQNYNVTGGLDPAEPNATLVIRGVGSGLLAGVNVDKTFTLSKARGGANAKTLTLLSNRQTISYDDMGMADPLVQTTQFNVNKQNTTATVTWTVTDAAGVARTPVTNFLSAATGDAVTMSEPQFNLARNNTSGVIVTATINDPAPILDRISIVKVQAGENGWDGEDGVDGIDGYDGKVIEFVWQRSETRPSTPVGNGIPANWFDDPPQGVYPLWMSKSKQELDGTIIESWSVPIRHDGPKGEDGKDGINSIAFIQEATPPAPPYVNQMWYKPSTKQYFYWTGTQWVPSLGDLARLNVVLANHIGARQIVANHLSVTEALITASAQIGSAVIDGAHIKNLTVDSAHIKDLTVGTNKIAPNTIGVPVVVSGADAFCPNYVITDIMTTGNVDVGDANDGGAFLSVYGEIDSTTRIDSAARIFLDVDSGAGFVNVATTEVGINTTSGNSYYKMVYMMSYAITNVPRINVRVRSIPFGIGSASDQRSYYIRRPKVAIFGSKR